MHLCGWCLTKASIRCAADWLSSTAFLQPANWKRLQASHACPMAPRREGPASLWASQVLDRACQPQGGACTPSAAQPSEDDSECQVVSYAAAVREAQRAGLDLMSVAPGAAPPVFKLGHADAAAHQARQREKETRKREVERRRRDTLKEVCGCPAASHPAPVCCMSARSARPRVAACPSSPCWQC